MENLAKQASSESAVALKWWISSEGLNSFYLDAPSSLQEWLQRDIIEGALVEAYSAKSSGMAFISKWFLGRQHGGSLHMCYTIWQCSLSFKCVTVRFICYFPRFYWQEPWLWAPIEMMASRKRLHRLYWKIWDVNRLNVTNIRRRGMKRFGGQKIKPVLNRSQNLTPYLASKWAGKRSKRSPKMKA